MIKDWKRLCQHVDEKEITENTRIKNIKKSFYKFSIKSIQNTQQSKSKFKISKTSIRSRRTKKMKTIFTNETDFFSNDDADDNMNVNNNFFVQQNLKSKKENLRLFFFSSRFLHVLFLFRQYKIHKNCDKIFYFRFFN